MNRFLYASALAVAALTATLAAPIASAIPPDFPDLAALSPADKSTYQAPGAPGSTIVRFNTAFGYTCQMGQYIQCYGKQLPGYINQTSLKDAECGQAISNEGSPAKFSPQPIYCTEFDSPVLPTGSKLSFQGSTCGVGADFTACVDSAKHGFVLRQDGNSSGF